MHEKKIMMNTILNETTNDELHVTGILHADGVLQLDHTPELPLGPVSVVITTRTDHVVNSTLLERLRAIWSIPCDGKPDGGEHTLQEVQIARDEWETDAE
jgi:hypothetical protein